MNAYIMLRSNNIEGLHTDFSGLIKNGFDFRHLKRYLLFSMYGKRQTSRHTKTIKCKQIPMFTNAAITNRAVRHFY